MPIPAGPAIAAAGSILDTAIGAITSGGAGRRNRRFAREMYWRQRNDALSDWNMQNTYNSPSAQMARLKEAGLNPNLVYGDGGSIMQAAVARGSDATMGNEQPLTGTRLGEAMNNYYNVKLANAQLTSQQLMQEKLRAETAGVQASTAKTIGETNINKFDLDRKNELVLQIIEDAWASTGLKKAQIDAAVHGNKRAADLHPYNVKLAGKLNDEKDVDIANKRLEGAMKSMQNGQYEQMRPIELAQARQQIKQVLYQIQNTIKDTDNKEQQTRLLKMEADAGKILQYIKLITDIKR